MHPESVRDPGFHSRDGRRRRHPGYCRLSVGTETRAVLCGAVARAKQHIPVDDTLLFISSWQWQVNLCSAMFEVTMQASLLSIVEYLINIQSAKKKVFHL